MTHEDETDVRRTSVSAKVLAFGCAIFAVLGSFWGIVWFIRAYVEAPRVNLPAPISLAAHDSVPAAAPAPLPSGDARAPLTATEAARQAAAPAALPASPPAALAEAKLSSTVSTIEDRWLPIALAAPAQAAPSSPPVPPPPTPAAQSQPLLEPANTAPAALATDPSEPSEDGVVEGTVPTIPHPAPLPRRKPTITAAVKRTAEPPLPRPRPDGPAPQSVWTSVPTSDDRYPSQ
jgi:hypothetical protein